MSVGEGDDEYDNVCCMINHLCCSLSKNSLRVNAKVAQEARRIFQCELQLF